MSITEILDRLTSVIRSRDGWVARCPAHPDRSPSLSIREGEKGILLYCHAGCRLEDIASAMEIRVSELFYSPATTDREEDAQARAMWKRAKESIAPHWLKIWGDAEIIVVRVREDWPDPGLARALALTAERHRVVAILEGADPR